MNTADEEPWKEEKEAPFERDSGIESLNTSTEEEVGLTQRIVEVVEFYFSDENVLRDSFLLKHVRRKREGYVNLKLVASFRKVRSLTRDWEVVREALRSMSTRLEVNAEGTKVRRRQPLPDPDGTGPSRRVVAFSLVERFTVESVAQAFSQCGPISMVQLLRPGEAVPPWAKRFLQNNPELNGCSAALVEFEHSEGASLAVREASLELRVMPLAAASSTGSQDDGGCPQVGVKPRGSDRISEVSTDVEASLDKANEVAGVNGNQPTGLP